MKNENGQALVSGLIFIMIIIFFCIYFIHYSESMKRVYTNSQIAKTNIIQKSSTDANILNEISINNRIILSQLIAAQNSFIKSAQIGRPTLNLSCPRKAQHKKPYYLKIPFKI
jgi:hypothetical protein